MGPSIMWEFPKTRARNVDLNSMAVIQRICYKADHKKDPQLILNKPY